MVALARPITASRPNKALKLARAIILDGQAIIQQSLTHAAIKEPTPLKEQFSPQKVQPPFVLPLQYG